MKRFARLVPIGAMLGSLLGFSGVASGFTISFQNNTGLDPNSYMICMQGFASKSAAFPNSANSQLTGSGTTYTFAAVNPPANPSDKDLLAVPLPAYPVVAGTTVNVQTSPTFDITGSRIYYYVVPKSATCQSFLGYFVATKSSDFAGFYNNFKASGAYVFSEVTAINGRGGVFDLSMVDSFALPAQAFTTGNTAGYNTLGQTDVSLQSPQNLQAIRADFVAAMSALGAAGEPYKRLATMDFSDEGHNYAYPSGTGPIFNPSVLLGEKISPPPANGMFYPGANSPLNAVFDPVLNALFSSTIYVNKTGNLADSYVGVPVATGLGYPIVGNPNLAPTNNPHLPASLPGMIFCNAANSANCTIATASFTAYNPVGMTIGNLGAPSYGYLTGVWQSNSRTIQFDNPLNVPQLINTSLFTNGIQGWYVVGATGAISDGSKYVVSCVPSCTSAAVTSITLDPSLLPQVPPVSGQVLLQAWPSGTGLGAPAPSSGASVFGNVGVLGGIGWSSYNADIINVLVSALNRGVSAMRNSTRDLTNATHTDSFVWAQESNWYPSGPVINQYSNYLHTRVLGGSPLFTRPNPAASSAQGLPMGMTYGFGYDEDPLNGVQGSPVPSKWEGTVKNDANILVTLGPWLPQSPVSQYLLQVTKAGTGAGEGTVTSIAVSPPGAAIDCGTECSASFTAGTIVTLKASGTAKFTGWSGACTGTTLTCEVTMSQAQNVTASFTTSAPTNYPLHVTVLGQGSVTGGGINCGTTCSADEPSGSPVQLTATTQGGSSFVGWSGACSGSTPTCTVTMDAAKQVTATFATAQQYTLTVTNAGGGSVTSAPAGIDCGSACIASFSAGTPVNVIAKPAAGYVFSGWSGACSGTQTCDLVMSSNKAVTATFTSLPPPSKVTLTVHDYGSGSVLSSPAGIDCGSACSYAFDPGTPVTLTAVAAAGWTFTGWSGGVCAGTGPCLITLHENETVNAVFASNPPIPPAPVPTLSEWALVLLSILTLGTALLTLRARRHG